MGTVLLAAITLIGNVYAQVDKQTKALAGLASLEARNYLSESNDVIQACTFLAQLEMLSVKCVDFIIDYRDSLEGLMDRYNNYESNASDNNLSSIPELNKY